MIRTVKASSEGGARSIFPRAEKAAQVGVEHLYTVNKVAELLSVEDSFVMELIRARRLTAVKLDEKTTRISAGSIQRYLANLVR